MVSDVSNDSISESAKSCELYGNGDLAVHNLWVFKATIYWLLVYSRGNLKRNISAIKTGPGSYCMHNTHTILLIVLSFLFFQN